MSTQFLLERYLEDSHKIRESNFYTLRIKTAVNFFSIQYVYLIDNVFFQEQTNLEQTTPVRQ